MKIGRPPTHGHTVNGKPSRTWASWDAMHKRCTMTTHDAYPRYGGRGIKVCERWSSFSNFLSDMGERPADTELDRFPNNDGDYEPSNCRWATRSQQARNRRSNVHLTFHGETMTMADWADRMGVPHRMLALRIRKGMPVARAITLPRRARRSKAAPGS